MHETFNENEPALRAALLGFDDVWRRVRGEGGGRPPGPEPGAPAPRIRPARSRRGPSRAQPGTDGGAAAVILLLLLLLRRSR